MCGLSSEQKCSRVFFFFHIKELGMHCLKLGDDITKALQREVEINGTTVRPRAAQNLCYFCYSID